MKFRRTLAVCGASIACALISATAALAAGTGVSVRVEGLKRTLLAKTVVHTHSGSITKGGTPAGTCPATSAAGALDAATHHAWSGTYSSGLGIDITKILGETLSFSHGYYWSIWIDNRYAQAGICDLTLHRGEQLLFAPYPAKGSVYPLVIKAPPRASTGRAFKVTVSYENAKGAPKPLAGVHLKDAAGVTNRRGTVMVTAPRAGTLKLTASHKGYIRSAAAAVNVSG